MKRSLFPSLTGGTIKAIASKSVAHRLLICAAFAQEESVIRCEEINEDIAATVRCLEAIGASIRRDGPFYKITPIRKPQTGATLDCGESGSTLRFLVPVACMLGLDASFQMAGRLPLRPLSPLREELERNGVTLSPQDSNPLTVRGALQATDFHIAGNVSSQFISGLLFAIAVSGKTGNIWIEGSLESAPYLDLTANALNQFGIEVIRHESRLEIRTNRGLHSPGEVSVEGDWSNAAFPLCLGVIGKEPVTVFGISPSSRQGDRAVLSLLREFGARIFENGDSVTASPSSLHGISIDASQIPDLVPVLATVASIARGQTVIHHASRLRLKESDRLRAVSSVLNALGASVTETDDGLIIEGVPFLQGGEADSFGDHRIAMSVAIASVCCKDTVILHGADATAKSYPGFWQDVTSLGLISSEL
ncbi:MAG: 3-phosphoshikimate 1-carboxyvinyltransferase [Clostridia bacterium]|nr:3-phosphoshikimate 1-carboxyvinyltransferase [Clostridia bacterium]